jgi:beta-glucuronidase
MGLMRLFGLIFMATLAIPALAQTRDQGVTLSASHNRAGQDLSGEWAYSIDYYRDGQFGFHGQPASGRALRYADISVAKEEIKNPGVLYEFGFDGAPTMTLPGAWNSAVPELRYYDGLIWFQRHFQVDKRPDGRAFLRFEAVNYKASVYLNGQHVGDHEGGFTPFSFDVTHVLRDGDNQVTIGVDSVHDNASIPPPVTDWDLYGGITRPMRLIFTPETFVDDVFVHLDADHHIRAVVTLNGQDCAAQAVALTIAGLKTKIKAKTDATCRAHMDVKAPKALVRWSPDNPQLYEVAISTKSDQWHDRIGFRTLKVVGDQILLNGKPIFLRGISMHEEELGENPSRNMTIDAARALLSEIKNGLHGNYVRLSHYSHAESTVRLADEMGLLVWSEIPVYWRIGFGDPAVLAKAKTMLGENILRDRNRASVIIWSIGNETPLSDDRNAFMGQLADETRRLDPTRAVSAAVLAERKTQDGKTTITLNDPLIAKLDIMAVNTYNGWYSDDDLDALPAFEWQSAYQKPLIFSEFGAGAKFGVHGDENAMKFSENYQAKYYQKTLAMADGVSFLRGLSPWILKDFRSPRRQNPTFQKGWNRKGLMDETGHHKQAFDVLARYYETKAKP